MRAQRQFRQLKVARKLDVKRLRAALHQTMQEMAKNPASEAAPVRLESVLIEQQQTTVYLSGNSSGLDAVVNAARSNFSDVKVSKARRADAMRFPRALSSRQSGKAVEIASKSRRSRLRG
jgi:hypothetical protein